MRPRSLPRCLLLLAALLLATRPAASGRCDTTPAPTGHEHHSAPAATTCTLGVACIVAAIPARTQVALHDEQPVRTPDGEALGIPADVDLTPEPPPPRA